MRELVNQPFSLKCRVSFWRHLLFHLVRATIFAHTSPRGVWLVCSSEHKLLKRKGECDLLPWVARARLSLQQLWRLLLNGVHWVTALPELLGSSDLELFPADG